MALIAIVDDSKLARLFASAALSGAGFEIAEVEPSELAAVLQNLRRLQPDLLVVDHNMPAFAGPTLVRACFEDDLLSTLKVVMLTAHHDEEMRRRMEKLGIHAVLHKPISPQELIDTVARITGPAPGLP
jgi:CheY-like chemotaxis protein